MQMKAGELTLAGFFIGADNDLCPQPNSLSWVVVASARHRMNPMDDHDIHQAFDQALPSQAWCLQPLVVALVDVRGWRPCLPGASRLLDPAENLRMQRKRKQGDREVLVLAYAMHRLLLGKTLGMDPGAVPLWRDAAGCPRVGDNLVHTSLSHAGDWIAMAVSRVGPVGVDIEPLSRTGMLAEMAGDICHPSELVELESLAVDQHAGALLALWVRKEALLKAAGTGLSVEMSSFAAPEGLGRPMPVLEGELWLEMLDSGPSSLAALARPAGAISAVTLLPEALR